MVRIFFCSLVLAGGEALGSTFAMAQNQAPVDPIPMTTPAEPPGPRLPKLVPQAADIETPTLRADPRISPRVEQTVAPRSVAPEPETAQVVIGLLVSSAAIIAIGAKTSAGTRENGWYIAAALAGGAVGTGAIVCAVGQTSPTRHGGCRASIIGALIGALGVVPGLFLLRRGSPCTATGPNADDQCAVDGAVDGLLDITFASLGYVLGTTFAARAGWELGVTNRFVSSPPAANISMLSLRF